MTTKSVLCFIAKRFVSDNCCWIVLTSIIFEIMSSKIDVEELQKK